MNTAEMTASIYSLPSRSIQRICQFLLDDHFRPFKAIITGRINDVLNFRATCSRFNNIIRNSSLRFGLSLELHYRPMETLDPDLLRKILTWLNSNSSWKCERILIIAGYGVNCDILIQKILPTFSQFDLIFSSKVNRLHIDCVRNVKEYFKIIKIISWLLSPKVAIALDIYLDLKKNNVPPNIPFAKNVEILILSNTYFPDKLPSGLLPKILRTFDNVQWLHAPDMRPIIWKEVITCKALRWVQLSKCKYSDFSSDNFHRCDHLAHLDVCFLEIDLKKQSKVAFSTIFGNLKSLRIDTCGNANDNDFDLPPSCETVKLESAMLKNVLNCPFIKNLMLRGVLKDEPNQGYFLLCTYHPHLRSHILLYTQTKKNSGKFT